MKVIRASVRRAASLGLAVLAVVSMTGCSLGRQESPVTQASSDLPEPTDSPSPADPSFEVSDSAAPVPSDTPSSAVAAGADGLTYLSGLTPVKDSGSDKGPYEISGKLYSSSLRTAVHQADYGPVDSDFLLARRCTRLTATLGMDDQQKDTTPAVASVLVDGKVAFTRKIVYGTATPLSVDVSNALRITVRTQWLSSEDSDEYAYVVWGDAGLQCTGDLPAPDV